MSKVNFGIHLTSSSNLNFTQIVSYANGCEEEGFDSVWVADHILLSNGYGLYEPLTLLAALSASTGRIRIGTSVLVACLRNPVLLADITGTLQLISNGCLNLSVGVGWDQHEFQNLSAEYKERGAVTG